ncbi:MAG: hypothetical protein IKT52_02445 [Oscillospiraceae bacterium]|nr:hypothetical protein [Oscillospiraceae bacterium]
MKKVMSLLLALVWCLFLCACGGESNTVDTPETTQAPVNAVKIDVYTFLKECSSNIVKASNDYEGKNCIIGGYITEIEKDHIALYYSYLYVDVFLPVEQIIELQINQYVEFVGTLENLEYDAYSGAFADLTSAGISNDTFVRTGEYHDYLTTDHSHPQGTCLHCVDDDGNWYYIALELSDEQKSTLSNGTQITVEGKLMNDYWNIMPDTPDIKMIDIVIR